jgi:hypothetical protein
MPDVCGPNLSSNHHRGGFNHVSSFPVHGVAPTISKLKLGSVLQPGASFPYIVQEVYAPSSSSFLVTEAPSLVIPMGKDVEEEEEYYRSMSLVCHFNALWPKLVDLNRWISLTWILSCNMKLSFILVQKVYS